ncbi:MAG: hypothetical protein VYA60_05225 [Pseudomonadota bacterium]|nr:hypothetical protein [Pseudomonadota bacterium]
MIKDNESSAVNPRDNAAATWVGLDIEIPLSIQDISIDTNLEEVAKKYIISTKQIPESCYWLGVELIEDESGGKYQLSERKDSNLNNGQGFIYLDDEQLNAIWETLSEEKDDYLNDDELWAGARKVLQAEIDDYNAWKFSKKPA